MKGEARLEKKKKISNSFRRYALKEKGRPQIEKKRQATCVPFPKVLLKISSRVQSGEIHIEWYILDSRNG